MVEKIPFYGRFVVRSNVECEATSLTEAAPFVSYVHAMSHATHIVTRTDARHRHHAALALAHQSIVHHSAARNRNEMTDFIDSTH